MRLATIEQGISSLPGWVNDAAVVLMRAMADLDGARALLAEAPGLGVGVHLALTGGAPVSPADRVPSLLAPDGRFHARGQDFITAWMRGRVSPDEVQRELDAQVARIREAGVP